MNEQRGDNRYNHCIRVLAENADEPKNFFSYYIAFTNVLPIKRDGYAFLERGTFANLLNFRDTSRYIKRGPDFSDPLKHVSENTYPN